MSEFGESGRVQIFQGKDEMWYWRLCALNGEIVAVSESYTRREDALRGYFDMRSAAMHPLIDTGGY